MTTKELETVIGANPDLHALNPHATKPIKRKSSRPAEPIDRMTGLEKSFLYYWHVCGGDPMVWLFGQHPFPERPRMHVDFKHVTLPVVVEVDGGQWMARSGHNNGRGIQRDAEKLALCNAHGLVLFRLTTDMVGFDEVMKIKTFVEERK